MLHSNSAAVNVFVRGILLTLLCNNSVVLVKENVILWKIKDAWLNERCVKILKCYRSFFDGYVFVLLKTIATA